MIIRRIFCAVAVAALVSGFAPLATAEHHEGGAHAECVKGKDLATSEEMKAYADAKAAAKAAGKEIETLRNDWDAKMGKRAKEQGKTLCPKGNPCNPCKP